MKLRLKSGEGEEFGFDYVSAPFSSHSLRAVPWVDFTLGEATYPHIRLHQLTEEDSLSLFISVLASIPATLAVVLINTRDDHELRAKFAPRSDSAEQGGCPVPMLVVTSETGREMMRILSENERNVEGTVELGAESKSQFSPALSSPSPRGTTVKLTLNWTPSGQMKVS